MLVAFEDLSAQFVKNPTNKKVLDLYAQMAGDRFDQLKKTVEDMCDEGKTFSRALADALEKHRLLPKYDPAE